MFISVCCSHYRHNCFRPCVIHWSISLSSWCNDIKQQNKQRIQVFWDVVVVSLGEWGPTFQRIVVPSSLLDPWRWRRYDLVKHTEPLSLHSLTSQKVRMVRNNGWSTENKLVKSLSGRCHLCMPDRLMYYGGALLHVAF